MATQNIPGVSFHIRDDGRLIPVQVGPITDTVLIIGNAVDGPINVPVRVDAKNVEQVFGPIVYDSVYASSNGDRDLGKYNGNTLVKSYAEVMQGGCTDIILMRVGSATHSLSASASYATFTAGSGATSDSYTVTGSGTTPLATLLGINVTAKYPGTVYNGIGLKVTYSVAASAITGATLEIRQDLKKKGRAVTIIINNGSGTTLTKRELINKINADVRNNAIAALSVDGDTNLDIEVPIPTTTQGASITRYYVLSNGTDGVRKDFGSTALEQAQNIYQAMMGSSTAVTNEIPDEDSPFARLETVETDIVLMAALYADENVGTSVIPQTIAVPFAKALHTAAKNDYPMVGVVGVKPSTESIPTKVSAIVDKLVQNRTGSAADALVVGSSNTLLNIGYFISQDDSTKSTAFTWIDPDFNETVDLGRYLVCVGGPDVWLSNAKIGQYIDSCAGVYAGLISTLALDRAVTNMPVPGVSKMAYSFTNKQLNKVAGGQPYSDTTGLSGGGGSYIALRKNSAGSIVVNLDNTCARRESDYASYQIIDIVTRIASGLKRVCEPFIGMAAHQTTKNALENQIRKFLDYIADSKAIAGKEGSGYNFEVSASGVDQLLGRINIDLTIRPAMQIKAINVMISVAPPTGI